jgi:hypothetical protein
MEHWGRLAGVAGLVAGLWGCSHDSSETSPAIAGAPFGVSVDSTYVYWTAGQIAPCETDPATAGAVMRAPVLP